MARLLGILLVTITSTPALAQQQGERSGSLALVESTFQETTAITLAASKRSFRMTIAVNRQATSFRLGQTARPLFMGDPTFIVENGAVHLSLFRDPLLIPMPGGGGSGCFSLDLPERIEKLRKSFQIFAPLPQQSIDKEQ